jgi:hypothetical protein
MKQKRKKHSPEFKVRAELEAIMGVKRVQQNCGRQSPAPGAGDAMENPKIVSRIFRTLVWSIFYTCDN